MKIKQLSVAIALTLGLSVSAFAVETVEGPATTSMEAPTDCIAAYYHAPEGVLRVPYVDVGGMQYSAELVHPEGNVHKYEVVLENFSEVGPAIPPQEDPDSGDMIMPCAPMYDGMDGVHFPRIEMMALDAMGHPATVVYRSSMRLDFHAPGLVMDEVERILMPPPAMDGEAPAAP